MTDFLNTLRTGYLEYVSRGQYIGLFFIILLFLWLTGSRKNNKVKTSLMLYAAVISVLVLLPLSAWVLLIYQTPFYTYSHLFLLLPVTLVMAWGLTEIMEYVMAYLEKQPESRKFATKHNKLCSGTAIAALTAILMLSGSVTLAAEPVDPAFNSWKIPQEVLEVLATLESGDMEEEVLLAPDEILEYARSYSGSFRLLYGRNMWRKELNAYTYDIYTPQLEEIHEWLNPGEEAAALAMGSNLTPEEAVEMLLESSCTVLVLRKEQYEDKAFKQAMEKAACFEQRNATELYIIMDIKK